MGQFFYWSVQAYPLIIHAAIPVKLLSFSSHACRQVADQAAVELTNRHITSVSIIPVHSRLQANSNPHTLKACLMR